MPEHKTSKDRVVDHKHRKPDLHAADQALARRFMKELFPQAQVVKEATLNYNCHGFALAPTHEGWYNAPDFFLSDDYTGTAESPRPGDVLVYGQNGIITHTAVVIETSGGTIVRVQSKWGGVAEVKHPVNHVPGVYGEPIVLLRRRRGLPQHPAVSGVTDAVADGGSGAEGSAHDAPQPPAEAAEAGTAETLSAGKQAPERFMLMLASTDEVERHIRQSLESTQGSGAGPFDTPTPINNSSEGPLIDNSTADTGNNLDTASTPSVDDTQVEIQNALAEFKLPVTQFQLMLASTPEVLREAAARLQPVQDLIRLDETNPETRRAIVKFFERPETQADDEITGITLFTMAQLPTQEAVPVIARYLAEGRFSAFNGSLAVDALKEAVAVATA